VDGLSVGRQILQYPCQRLRERTWQLQGKAWLQQPRVLGSWPSAPPPARCRLMWPQGQPLQLCTRHIKKRYALCAPSLRYTTVVAEQHARPATRVTVLPKHLLQTAESSAVCVTQFRLDA